MDFQKIYEEAEEKYRKGKAEEAVSLLEETLGKNLPSDMKIEFHYLLGKYQAAFHRDQTPLKTIQKGIDLARREAASELEEKGGLYLDKIRGEIALHRGDSQEASDAYVQARLKASRMGLEEEEIDLQIRESKAYFYLGDDLRARKILEEVLVEAEKGKYDKYVSTIRGNLGDIYLREGKSDKAYEFYQTALELAEESGNESEIVENHSRLGKYHFYRGETEKALDRLSEAVKLAREKDNALGQIDALGTLGKIYFFIGENEAAKESYRNALKLADEVGDALGKLNNLGNLGNVYLRLGQMEECLKHFKKALKLAREIQDAQGEMNALGWLGDIYYQKGKNIKALNHYYKALELARRLGSLLGESSNLSRIGDIYFSRYENDTAFSNYEEALKLARQANSPPAILNNLISLGDIYFRRGEDDQALRHYEEALVIAYELNTPQGSLNSLQSLAEVFLRRGREDEALHRFKQALGLSRKLEDPVAEIASLRGIGDVFYRKGKYKKSSAHHKKALEIAQTIEDHLEELIQKSKIGEVYLKRGRRKLAQKYFSQSYELARKYDSAEGLLTSLLALGNFDVEQGNFEEAEKKFTESLTLSEKLDEPLARIQALARLGWIGFQQGDFAEAHRAFQETTALLEPIASGDIEEEEELDAPETSRKKKLENLKQKVVMAAQENPLESSSQMATSSSSKDKEDTGEFQAVTPGASKGETGKYEVSLEAPIAETKERTRREIAPGLTKREATKINKKSWKHLEERLFGATKAPEVLHGVIGLGKMNSRKALSLLEKAYGEYKNQPQILKEIIKGLDNLSERESGPTLSRLFREEERPELRIDLAEALARQGHLGGVEYLLQLAHREGSHQKRAIEALGNSGQKEVIPSLQEIREENPGDERLSTSVLAALLSLGHPRAQQELMDELNSSDLTNMFFTARALAQAGKSSALLSLETIIETIIDKQKPSQEEFDILQKAVEERLALGGEIEALLEKIYAFKPLRAPLFLMLDESSAPHLYDHLREVLKSGGRWEIRANAAHALGYTGKKALPLLKKFFSEEKEGPVSMATGGALIRIFQKIGID